jgi:hypothetical protein
MSLKRSHVAAIALLLAGVILNIVFRNSSAVPDVVSASDSTSLLELRLKKLRALAATVPAKTTVLKTVQSLMQAREKGVMSFATASQAQAHLLEVVHRVASANKIEARGGDFAAPSLLGADYGQVAVSVLFECPIESFVNFLADLSKESELIAPSEVHVAAGNVKTKTINVRMTLAGVVSRKLVPEKKSLSSL